MDAKIGVERFVGSKYQDLLESTDSVMRMYEMEINSVSLLRIKRGKLIRSISARRREETVERRERIIGCARKIKQLMKVRTCVASCR